MSEMMLAELIETSNGNEPEAPAPPRSYAEATLDAIANARENGKRAIEHYEARRADLDATYRTQRAELDAHLKALRMACWDHVAARPTVTRQKAPKKAAPVVSAATKKTRGPSKKPTLADRIAVLLTEHRGGPMTYGMIAQKLGRDNASINSAIRSRSSQFVQGKDHAGRLTAELHPATP
jgi:hypothetical protein